MIVMPAHNEVDRIVPVLVELRERLPDIRVLVVDDGSSDATSEVAAAAGAFVVRLPFNLGYGAALQTGYKYAVACGFEFVVQMDADGQHRPVDVPGLLARVTSGACDLVIGSRFMDEAQGTGVSPSGDTRWGECAPWGGELLATSRGWVGSGSPIRRRDSRR